MGGEERFEEGTFLPGAFQKGGNGGAKNGRSYGLRDWCQFMIKI